MNCTVSRDRKTWPRSGLAISHCEGSLIKGNGVSGNFECVFSVVFSACLGDSNSKTDAETIRAGGRMFLLPVCPLPPLFSSRLVIAHQSCRLSVKVDFIVSLLGAVVSFFQGQGSRFLQRYNVKWWHVVRHKHTNCFHVLKT